MQARDRHQVSPLDMWEPLTEFFGGYLMGMLESAMGPTQAQPGRTRPTTATPRAGSDDRWRDDRATHAQPEGRVGLVVHPDEGERRRIHLQLVGEGFDSVLTCPGPDHVDCAVLDEPARQCAKLHGRVDRAVVFADYARCGLLDNYRERQPIMDVVVHTAR